MDLITVRAQLRSDPGRWISLTLGLRNRAAGEPFLQRDALYSCGVRPLDSQSTTYSAINWESGVLSGAGFAVRHWLNDNAGLLLYHLAGQLGADGIQAIAEVTAEALAALTGHAASRPTTSDWELQTQSDSRNDSPRQLTTSYMRGTGP